MYYGVRIPLHRKCLAETIGAEFKHSMNGPALIQQFVVPRSRYPFIPGSFLAISSYGNLTIMKSYIHIYGFIYVRRYNNSNLVVLKLGKLNYLNSKIDIAARNEILSNNREQPASTLMGACVSTV